MTPFAQLLKERGLSVYKVAKEIGLPPTTLYDLANGSHTTSTKTLQKVADHFGVPLSYLTTGEREEVYYEDPLTAELAQKLKDDHDLRLLFSAAKDAAPETLQATYDVLLALKKRERGEND